MPVAKGKTLKDGTYIYTCGKCHGAGFFGVEPCPHCYNLDYKVLMQHFETARGERYYALLKAILSIKGKAMVDRVATVRSKSESGKISLADLLHIFMEFEFPINRFKPFAEWLEEARAIPTGTYQRIKDSRFGIKKGLIQLGLISDDGEIPEVVLEKEDSNE